MSMTTSVGVPKEGGLTEGQGRGKPMKLMQRCFIATLVQLLVIGSTLRDTFQAQRIVAI